jgi:L-galactono-1,4-lactone dehydrogenase
MAVQVSAHGTGAAIPPVDEQVVALKLVTPGCGTLEVTREADPELFDMCRVGLGALGVVAEITLQCVPAHQLLEHTFVTSMRVIRRPNQA